MGVGVGVGVGKGGVDRRATGRRLLQVMAGIKDPIVRLILTLAFYLLCFVYIFSSLSFS